MSQYCDTSKLEAAWFNWIMVRAVPSLEPFREAGMLWTKSIGLVEVNGAIHVKGGKVYNSPTYPIRAHCILSIYPVFFTTFEGKAQELGTILSVNENKIHSQPIEIKNVFDNKLEALGQPPEKMEETLLKDGYIKENTQKYYWDLVLRDINNMCMGVSTNFHQKTEEEQIDLANEALLQVITKLVSNRLVYTPGRAPVFNLLTTTIFRCMYSIMNKRKNQRKGINKLLADASAGKLPKTMSLRHSNIPKRSR